MIFHVIDNSDRAVASRLDYLRYNPVNENHAPSIYDICLPDEVLKLPREITYRIPSVDYAVMRCVDDAYHYSYDLDQVYAMIDDDDYYDESMDIGVVAANLTGRYYGLFEMDPDGTGDNVVVPLSTSWLGERLELPEEVSSICGGLIGEERLLISLIHSNLTEDSWREMNWNYCTEKQFLCRTSVNSPERQYYVYFHMNIDLRINSIPADKCHLTLTERSLIMGAIKSGILNGRLLSDGKEQKNRLDRESLDTLLSDKRLLAWYGPRYTDIYLRDNKKSNRRY